MAAAAAVAHDASSPSKERAESAHPKICVSIVSLSEEEDDSSSPSATSTMYTDARSSHSCSLSPLIIIPPVPPVSVPSSPLPPSEDGDNASVSAEASVSASSSATGVASPELRFLRGIVLAPSLEYLRNMEHPPQTCVSIFTYGTSFDDAEDLHATIVRDLPALLVGSKLGKHDGCHPEILFRFIRSEQFPTWMIRLRECIIQCRRQRLEVQRYANVQAPRV